MLADHAPCAEACIPTLWMSLGGRKDPEPNGPGGATPEEVPEADEPCAPRKLTGCRNPLGNVSRIADSCLWLTLVVLEPAQHSVQVPQVD